MESKFTWLVTHCLFVSVEANPHRTSYMTAAEFIKTFDLADETIGEITETSPLYSVQVYPTNPTGFYSAIGHDLEAVLDSLITTVSPELGQ